MFGSASASASLSLSIPGHEVDEPLSPAGPVQGLGLWFQFRRPGAKHEALRPLVQADPLR
jgi:hypothetical protein